MLPHGDDFDWADDGGMIRRVTLQIRESDCIEYAHITEQNDSMKNGFASGRMNIIKNTDKPCTVKIYDYSNARLAIQSASLNKHIECCV